MNYIDGVIAAVPTANREQYRQHADKAAAVFKKHGAISLAECWGDDVPMPFDGQRLIYGGFEVMFLI